MTPSFSRVWKEIGVANWAWDTRSILMIPEDRPSLVLLRNAKGSQPVWPDPGLVISRIDKAGVPAALGTHLLRHRRGRAAPEGPREGTCGPPSWPSWRPAGCCCP